MTTRAGRIKKLSIQAARRQPREFRWLVTWRKFVGRRRRQLFVTEAAARVFYQKRFRDAVEQRIERLPTPIRNGPRKILSDLKFYCARPGEWFSECGRFVIFHYEPPG